VGRFLTSMQTNEGPGEQMANLSAYGRFTQSLAQNMVQNFLN